MSFNPNLLLLVPAAGVVLLATIALVHRLRRAKPGARYETWTLHRCLCCGQTVQVLKIDTSGPRPRYKVAYYNAIIGGRHWVSEGLLNPIWRG